MATRSIVYIDGLNLYYGALKGTAWRWLDIAQYFHRLRTHDSIQAIKYFTAKFAVSVDHETYLAALATTKIQIILGTFKHKTIPCRVTGCTYAGKKYFTYPEEKKTDVNIGIHMVSDAYQNLYDLAIIVTGDSDLVPALEMITKTFRKKKIICYVPDSSGKRGIGADLRKSPGSQCRILPNRLVAVSQLPPRIPDGKGGFIVKPASW